MTEVVQVERLNGDNAETAFSLIEEYYEAVSVAVRDDRGMLHKYAADPDGGIWVAYCDGQPAACVLLRSTVLRGQSQTEAAGEVKRLFVRPAYRGQGIAVRLLAELEAFAEARGFRWLYLDSKDDLAQAIRFYERSGYQPCERYNDNPQATIFMRKALTRALTMRPFQAGDEAAFCQMNEAWIEKHFALEEKDRKTLREPEKYILSQGGQIWIAVLAGTTVGCCALIPLPNGDLEVSKMAVSEAQRGRGIGRRLLQQVIAESRRRGVARLYLETNSKLENAVHLYQSAGFRPVPAERLTPSPYQRANVFMEMVLLADEPGVPVN